MSSKLKVSLILYLAIILCLSLLLTSNFSCKSKSKSPDSSDSSQGTVVPEIKDIGQKPDNLALNSPTSTDESKVNTVSADKQQNKLPKLIDLGADKCIPCKMMKPILDELKTEYEGKLAVEFVDVWENPKESERYGISLIPTQIFYDPEGKEFQRHEGFISKEDILATFNQKGIKLDGK